MMSNEELYFPFSMRSCSPPDQVELFNTDLMNNSSTVINHYENSSSSSSSSSSATPFSLDYMEVVNEPILGLQNSLLRASYTINHGTTDLPPLPYVNSVTKLLLLNDDEFIIFQDKGTSINIEQVLSVAPRRKGHSKRGKNTFGETGSIYRGVSRYGGRFEVFLWDNTNPNVKSKTIYVAGGYEVEKEAAKAYDLAALKVWGKSAPLNFPISDYEKDLEEMESMTRTEYLHSIRRRSDGFAKGISCFRGVSRLTRNTKGKKWQARMGKGKGIRGIYLGTFETEEEAAKAYDVAVIRMKGLTAATNFELNQYDLKNIFQSKRLPIGKGASKMLKMTDVEDIIRSNKTSYSFDNYNNTKKKKKQTKTMPKNKKTPALQLKLDHNKIIHTDQNIYTSKGKEPMAEYPVLTSSATNETTHSSAYSNENAQMFPNYYNQNPSGSSLADVNQQNMMMYPYHHEVIDPDYSSYGMTTGSSSSSAPALGFQSDLVMSDKSHSEMIETNQNSNFGDQYGLLSDNLYSPDLQDLELEKFREFLDNLLEEPPNPSVQTNDMSSTNPLNPSSPNPSFVQVLADGDTGSNPSGSYLRTNDQDGQGNNLAIATEAGKEVESTSSPEYYFDFDDFFLNDNEDLQSFIENPNNFI